MPLIPPSIAYLTLWPTTACNLACAYCYASQGEAPQTMDRQTALAALELAGGHDGPLHVQLAGGEPTLVPELIEAVAQWASQRQAPTRVAVQTNGALLTPALAAMFKRWRVAVGLSLDGPPEVQELQRGQAAQVMAGLEILERAGVDFYVTAVVTAASAPHLPRLLLMLAGQAHARGLGLDLLTCRGRAVGGHAAMARPDALAGAASRLAQLTGWLNARRTRPFVLRELERLRQPGPVFCQAQAGRALAVHPSGRLYPCGQTMNDPDLALGSLAAPDWRKNGLLGREALTGPHCAGCPLAGRCPGECPSRLRYNGPQGRALACAMLRALAQPLAAHGENAHASA